MQPRQSAAIGARRSAGIALLGLIAAASTSCASARSDAVSGDWVPQGTAERSLTEMRVAERVPSVEEAPRRRAPAEFAPFVSRTDLMAAIPGVRIDGGADDAPSAAKKADTPVGDESAGALAKQTQNPIADLISLPIETAWNFDVGDLNRTQTVVTVKPVYPQHINADWNWIHRLLVPTIDQPKLVSGSSSKFGLGDTTYQGFLSPAKSEGITWGVGPALTFPTATDDVLGTDKWTAGPAVVLLNSSGPWVYGSLLSNQWQIGSSDSSRRRVGNATFQPFVNYNLSDGWYLSSAPVITANWKADHAGDAWTVPLGVGVGKVMRFSDQPVNISVRPYYNVHRPDGAARWSLLFQIQFLFPK